MRRTPLPLTRAERNTHRSDGGDGGNQLLGLLKDRVETSEARSGFFASADVPLLAQSFDDCMRDCLDEVGNLLVCGARKLIERWFFRDRKNTVEDQKPLTAGIAQPRDLDDWSGDVR
jgi:hypothetical protein